MSEWRQRRLGTLAEFHNQRRVPLSKAARRERQGPYRYYGAQGVIDHVDDYLFDGQFLLVAEDGENLRSRKQPIARLVTGQFWVNNHAHIVAARDGAADDRFLLHALNMAALGGRVTGAAQPKLTKANLQQTEILAPSIATQRRVAAALTAFDELIEINERRIELLEDLARSLYREWFVRFRFPGRENGGVVGSEVGPIPTGWRLGRLGDLAETVMNGVSPDDVDPREPYVGLEHLPRRQTTLREWGSADAVTSRKLRFARGDTLFGKIRPYFHKVVWAPEPGVASSDAIVFRPKGMSSALTAMVASSDPFVAHSVATSNGTKMPRADARVLLDYRLVIPPPDSATAARFERTVGMWLDRSAQLVRHNRRLANTRDLLLPRLVTGRLDISEVDLGDLLPAEAA